MSKDFFDVAYLQVCQKSSKQKKAIYLGRYPNETRGFQQMLSDLKKLGLTPDSNWFICFENTGIYSKALLEWLTSKKIACREENALKIAKSLGIRRGKDDKIDAKAICHYAFEKRDTIQPSALPDPDVIKLRKLLSRRELLVRQKRALEVSFKEQRHALKQDLLDILQSQNNELIAIYEKQIGEIESEIEQVIKNDKKMSGNNNLAQSVVGIGPIIAANMIAATENFTCFESSRQFACYSGIAPFPNRSGKQKGKNSVSHLANKKIKALLSNAANAAILYDNQIRLYYERKLKEGKQKGIVINAVKNKLIHRIFAVIKRQKPYVRLGGYA